MGHRSVGEAFDCPSPGCSRGPGRLFVNPVIVAEFDLCISDYIVERAVALKCLLLLFCFALIVQLPGCLISACGRLKLCARTASIYILSGVADGAKLYSIIQCKTYRVPRIALKLPKASHDTIHDMVINEFENVEINVLP